MVRLILGNFQIQAEAFRAAGKWQLFKLQQVCHETMAAIQAAYGGAPTQHCQKIAGGLAAGLPELCASTLFATESEAFHEVTASLARGWAAT
jgi:hypothetical protein